MQVKTSVNMQSFGYIIDKQKEGMILQRGIEKEIRKLEQKEKKCFSVGDKKTHRKVQTWTGKIEEKIPEKLYNTIHTAFYKAFYLVFEKGTTFVEKTFSKEKAELEFRVNDFRIEESPTRKSIRKLEHSVKKGKRRNVCITTVEGIGLGIFGVGLPDIPLFLGMVMKGLYEIATGYGFSYDTQEERIFLLRIICGALSDGTKQKEADAHVEEWMMHRTEKPILDFDVEIRKAADVLAHSMLVAKFVQGLPIAGVFGGAINPFIYHRIMKYAELKYKKRYLLQKMKK